MRHGAGRCHAKNLLPELPPSGGYENIVIAIDVFSRYACSYSVSNPTSVNTSKVINMTKHKYLRKPMITDEGSIFNSQVISDVAALLDITLKYETNKNAQTIGVSKRTHATVKNSLKMA